MDALDDFELIDVDVWDKESSDCREYTDRVHPHTTVPALDVGGKILIESGAICMYLADSYNKCLPSDMSDYYNIMFYACATLDEVMEILFVQYFFKEPKGIEDKEQIKHARHKFDICANYLTNMLTGNLYICGDQFSAADCVVGYNIWWASEIKNGILLKDFPILLSYLYRLKNRQAFKKTWNNL